MDALVYFKTKLFEYREQRNVQRRFYLNAQYKQADLALLRNYRYSNPFQISKRYQKLMGKKNLHIYGETPLTTMGHIAEECALTPQDFVIEMGAGRGRAGLFLAEYIGCKVLAYEEIPLFLEKMPPSKNLTMIGEDMFSAPFSQATTIYLYGTLLEDRQIEALCEVFPPNTKIITVSYSLNSYSENYRVIKSFSGRFAWGETEIYLNERIR